MNSQKVKVLVSTSEDDIFRSVEMLLGCHLEARGGVQIARVTHSEECVRMASSGNCDLLIFFGQTTSASGPYMPSRVIRAIKANTAIPIIALSTIPGEDEQLLAAGANVFLAMPYRLNQFSEAVDRCLAVQPLRRRSDLLNTKPVTIVSVSPDEGLIDSIMVLVHSRFAVDLKSFNSSPAAWQELLQNKPDLLITDCVMDRISGQLLVCELVNRKFSYPILVHSGFMTKDDVLGWCPGAPHIAFLERPFTPDEFYAELDKHFEPIPIGLNGQMLATGMQGQF